MLPEVAKVNLYVGLPWWLRWQKKFACNVEDKGSFPGLGRFLGSGHGHPFQSSCLENSMDRGAWQTMVYGIAKSHDRATKHSTSQNFNTVAFIFRT